jgi:hypothetical protein
LSAREMAKKYALKRFRNYCGLIKIARSGFPWEKTTKRFWASVYTNCESAVRALIPILIRDGRVLPDYKTRKAQGLKALMFVDI